MASVIELIKHEVVRRIWRIWRTGLLWQMRVGLHFLAKAPHESDFLALRHPAFGAGLFFDRGGNIGQSAISVHKVQPDLRVQAMPRSRSMRPCAHAPIAHAAAGGGHIRRAQP